MRSLACTAFLAVVIAACNRSCTAPAPSVSPDAQSIAVVSFDEVTDKVWDVDVQEERPTAATLPLYRSAIRHAMDCIKRELEAKLTGGQLLAGGFSIATTMRIGPGERVDILPEPRSQWLPEPLLQGMGHCLETQFRAMGVFEHTGDSTVSLRWNSNFDFFGGGE